MSLSNRITEHPGRIILTPVPGEENTYDVTRAEGEVINQGTPLDKDKIENALKLVTEDYTGTVTYEAGTIGSRATAVSLGTAAKNGYKLISLTVISASNASAYNILPYVSSSTVYAGIYRATTAAVSGAAITVRAAWMPV